MGLQRALVHEDGDRVYIVTPVQPMQPSAQDIEEYAFGKSIVEDLRRQAPNEHIAWYGGQYVEADKANLNGAMWLSDELAVKSLTPMFMPVTVMHDPRSAVGVIADTRLIVPPAAPRNKIETALAVWRHRFPEVVEEAEANYTQGTLMQSMECLAPDYLCSECGAMYHKLPGGAEQENWCAHLKASDPSGGFRDLAADRKTATAVRILRNVVFTGTGLIFGTQGGRGADPEANLESFFGEIAEFHDRAHSETTTPRQRSTPSMSETVAKTEFDRVVAERDAAVRERDELRESNKTLKTEVESAEQAKKAAEEKAEAEEKKVKDFEEKARKSELASERLEALGEGFVAKLGDKTKGHLREDAASLSDEDWNRRLEGVEELAGVKRDADKDGGGDGGDGGDGKGGGDNRETFSREEVAAAAHVGGASHSNGAKDQTASSRRSVIGGLARPKKTEETKS